MIRGRILFSNVWIDVRHDYFTTLVFRHSREWPKRAAFCYDEWQVISMFFTCISIAPLVAFVNTLAISSNTRQNDHNLATLYGIVIKHMEEAPNKKPVFDMGIATSEAFRGDSAFDAVKEIYGNSAPLFASIIRSKFPVTEKEYALIDVGSYKGELLSDILKLLPEYHFNITVSDTNSDAIAHNTVSGKHVVADAESLPFDDASIDIVAMRYVLQFNLFEVQKKIISEISRVTKGIAIVQHGGADDIDTDLWREKVDKIFRNDTLPQIKRNGMFWSSASEIEDFMRTSNIKFEKVLSKKISGMSQAFIERYSLNNEQVELIKKIMGDKDYLIQTTWLIHPKETIRNS